jgi:hypothetical protein
LKFPASFAAFAPAEVLQGAAEVRAEPTRRLLRPRCNSFRVEGNSPAFSQRRTAAPLLYLCRASPTRFDMGSNHHAACGLVSRRFLAEKGHAREHHNWPSGRMLAQGRCNNASHQPWIRGGSRR